MQVLGAERISTTEYVKSLWPTRRNKKEKRTEYLYKQFRTYRLRPQLAETRFGGSSRSLSAATSTLP